MAIKQIGGKYYVSTPLDGVVAGPFNLKRQAIERERQEISKHAAAKLAFTQQQEQQ